MQSKPVHAGQVFEPWARRAFALVALVLCSAFVACAEESAKPAAERPPPGGVTPAATAPGPQGLRVTGTLALRVAPLAELSAPAAAFLAGREPQWGVAAVLPGRGAVFEANAQEPFPMASLAKVPVTLTVMQQAIDAGRPLTVEEETLMWAALTESDNDAALSLWERAGGGEAVARFLAAAGVRGIEPPREGPHWGDTTATAEGVAQLLAKLREGAILDAAMRGLAFSLMTRVVDEQRWGATAAFPGGREPGAVALKNGWYPAIAGWRVTSAAISIDAAIEPLILVVMTRTQESFEYGAETIEGVAARIGAAVYGDGPGAFSPDEVIAHAPTAVQRYLPEAAGLETLPGECRTASGIVRREDALRCVAEGEVVDPCFAAATAPAVAVCGVLPGREGAGFTVPIGGAVSGARRGPAPAAWALLLEDGAACIAVREPPINEDDDRPSYRCDDGSLILGPPQRTETWWVYRVPPGETTGRNVPVALAWT